MLHHLLLIFYVSIFNCFALMEDFAIYLKLITNCHDSSVGGHESDSFCYNYLIKLRIQKRTFTFPLKEILLPPYRLFRMIHT